MEDWSLIGETVTAENFRTAWSRFATGVTVITTAEPDGKVHGMTANGVVSVSLEPPLALASIGHNRNSYELVKENHRFGISILTIDQRHVAEHYTRPPDDRGSDATIDFATLGKSKVIADALAAMDCRVISEHREGDHTLFVAEVEHVGLGKGEPMLWVHGRFGRFAID